LIGEEIEGAWNEAALRDAACLFGGQYVAYRHKKASDAETARPPTSELCQTTGQAAEPCSRAVVNRGRDPDLRTFDYLIAAENSVGAQSVYQFRPPATGNASVLVGNEARGLRGHTLKQADAVVEIPLASRNINCLNVAAAAAVMLYYFGLEQPLALKHITPTAASRRRPDLLLIGGADHMELGSTIRSVCAIGWDKVFLNDPMNSWYECDRRIKSEGRGTARRGRNPIKVIPHGACQLADYRKLVIFTTEPCGRPLWQVPLIGRDLLAVLPDESIAVERWRPPDGWNGDVIYARLPEASPACYHYRQMSAIALAEIARQVGRTASSGVYLKSRKDRYRRAVSASKSELSLDLEDLLAF
jgi:hypothetical protein